MRYKTYQMSDDLLQLQDVVTSRDEITIKERLCVLRTNQHGKGQERRLGGHTASECSPQVILGSNYALDQCHHHPTTNTNLTEIPSVT